MKLDIEKLKQIILEEIEANYYPIKKSKIKSPIEYDLPSEVETEEDAWSGGPNLHSQEDHAKKAGSDATTRSQEFLKITEGLDIGRLIRESIFKNLKK